LVKFQSFALTNKNVAVNHQQVLFYLETYIFSNLKPLFTESHNKTNLLRNLIAIIFSCAFFCKQAKWRTLAFFFSQIHYKFANTSFVRML